MLDPKHPVATGQRILEVYGMRTWKIFEWVSSR